MSPDRLTQIVAKTKYEMLKGIKFQKIIQSVFKRFQIFFTIHFVWFDFVWFYFMAYQPS